MKRQQPTPKPVADAADNGPAYRAMKRDLALGMLQDESNALYALAHALEARLRPADENDLREDEDMVAWGLAKLLFQRVESTKLLGDVRSLLVDEFDPAAAPKEGAAA